MDDKVSPLIIAAAGEVFSNVGVTAPKVFESVACGCNGDACNRGLNLGVGYHPHSGDTSLFVGVGVVSFFTPSELRGILCHEAAHVHYGDILSGPLTTAQSFESEYRADRFTMQHGYAEGLLSAFLRLTRRYPIMLYVEDSHPSLGERISRLEQWLKWRTPGTLSPSEKVLDTAHAHC